MRQSLSRDQLSTVGKEVEQLVPRYDLLKFDPLQALREGVGNCLAKAAVASGLIHIEYGIDVALGYSDRLHGLLRVTRSFVEERTKANYGHVTLAVANSRNADPYDVLMLHYGTDTRGDSAKDVREKEYDPPEVQAYNTLDIFVQADPVSGKVTTTSQGEQLGLVVGDWRETSARYLDALDMPMFDVERLLTELEPLAAGRATPSSPTLF